MYEWIGNTDVLVFVIILVILIALVVCCWIFYDAFYPDGIPDHLKEDDPSSNDSGSNRDRDMMMNQDEMMAPMMDANNGNGTAVEM